MSKLKETLIKAQEKLDKLLSQKDIIVEKVKIQQKVVDDLLFQFEKEELEETKALVEQLENKGVHLKELVDAVENQTLDKYAEKIILSDEFMEGEERSELN